MGRLLCLGVAALLWTSQQAVFRARVETVAVYATVNDSSGRLVPGLTAGDFEVRDNGRPVSLDFFSSDTVPITVAVMLDMSGSMERRFLRVRESTGYFIDALRADDRAQIGSFGSEIALSPLLTGDKSVLKRVVAEELWPGGGTPLWNAIDTAMTALAPQTGRRVVLVLTDGADTGNLPGYRGGASAVRDRARDEGFILYAIGMQRADLEHEIVELAEATGGGHFNLADDANLSETLAQVLAELRQQYTLGFTPAALDGKRHKLEVRATRADLRVRARTSYTAVPR